FLEQFQEKCEAVFRPECCKNKCLERVGNSIKSSRLQASGLDTTRQAGREKATDRQAASHGPASDRTIRRDRSRERIACGRCAAATPSRTCCFAKWRCRNRLPRRRPQ